MYRFPFVTVCLAAACFGLALTGGCSSDEAPTPPVACSIELSRPEAADQYIVPPIAPDDELVTIHWAAAGGGQVGIELLKGGVVRGDIIAATPNDGFYFWWIADPEDLALLNGTGDDYAVRVTSEDDGTCTDTSPEFRIWDREGCNVEVAIDYPGWTADPPGDAVAGEEMTITWVPTNTTGSYDIDFFQAFGSTPTDSIAPIAVGVSGEEFGPWIMHSFHSATSGRYAIRVRDHDDPDCYDFSPAFTMLDPDICVIDVLQPMSAHSPLTEGEQFEIIWGATNTSGLLDIKLRTNTLQFVVTVASGVAANLGAFNWTVDTDGFQGEVDQQYRLFIYDAADEYCSGSSGSFRIEPAP